MRRVLLILPTATYRASAFLAAARKLEIEVVTASEQPQALAGVMGDNFLELDLEDTLGAASAIVDQARHRRLDAVVAVDDQGSLIAAQANKQLGLAGNPPSAVAATRDKVVMRTTLEKHQVPQPRWRAVVGTPHDPTIEASAAVRAGGEIGFPVVVKPSSLAASRGVIRADDAVGLAAVVARVRRIAGDAGIPPEDAILVEGFVAGPEYAVEGLLDGGRLHVLAVFDKPDPLDGPYFEETIYVTPSRCSRAELAAMTAVIEQAIAALGLSEGPIHAELRRGGDDVPVLIEIAARTIGGRCSAVLSFAGRSLEELVLHQALGGGVAAIRAEPSGVMMIPIASSGRLAGIEGLSDAQASAGITGVEIAIAPGRQVHALPEGDRYLGFIFATGETAEIIEGRLREALGRLTIHID